MAKSNSKTPTNLGGMIKTDRTQLQEINYFDQLTEEEQLWYLRWLDNHYNARYHKDGKDIYVPGTEDAKESNRYKQRRLKDLTSKMDLEKDGESDSLIEEGSFGNKHKFGFTIYKERGDRKTPTVKKKAPKQIPLNFDASKFKTETVEEFLKRKNKKPSKNKS